MVTLPLSPSSRQSSMNVTTTPQHTVPVNEYEAIALVEESKKKKIAEGWSDEQEQILKKWAEKAAGYRWLHEQSARHYRRLNNRLVYPQILINTIAGVGGFGITTSGESRQFAYVGYAIAVINIIGALLTSFQKFISAAEKSEMHSTVERQFAAFFRNISLELALNPRDRTECIEMCKSCRYDYDRLMNVAPSVPQKIILRFKDKFPYAVNKPDIANGLSDLKIWEKEESTKTNDAFVKMKMFYKMLFNKERFSDAENNIDIIQEQ
jgi:hypothetical protein